MPETTIPLTGKIHSFESMGTLDGPGIRFVVFFAGCPLRCRFCHNIDIACGEKFESYTPAELIQKILPNKPYFDYSGGGVTISGGEPFFQPEFLIELLRLCKEKGFHTALDTSLHAPWKYIEQAAKYTDLFMISLKHFDDTIHRQLTGASNKLILKNIKKLNELGKQIRFRLLVLPGYTDTKQNLTALVAFLKEIEFTEIELLAYHDMGVYKWEALGMKYELKDVVATTKEQMKQVENLLIKHGFQVLVNE